MIKDRLIVCVASSWDYDPTSKHHIMKILSKENDILWINYHGSRRPEVNTTDLKDMCAALKRVAHGVQRVSPSFVQMTPLVIPGAASPMLESLHQRMVITQIRRAIRHVRDHDRRPIQVWSFAPDVPYLVGALDEECFLYYCVDEYRQFEGFDPERIATAEDELMDRADVVITSSQPLLNTKRAHRGDAVLVRHGVDYDHFSSAWRTALAAPADLARIQRPIFGFFGLIHHWVDRALLAEVARLRPDYSFVLIGDCKVDVSELQQIDNVFLIGRRPYEELPAYCTAFDAGLMFFVDSPMTRNINPVKMYEYLAAGLPIVSTPLPEAERFMVEPPADGPIRFAKTPQQFAEACDQVLGCGTGSQSVRTPAASRYHTREKISRIVRNETWSAKVEYLSDIVMGRQSRVLRSAALPKKEVGPWTPVKADAAPATL